MLCSGRILVGSVFHARKNSRQGWSYAVVGGRDHPLTCAYTAFWWEGGRGGPKTRDHPLTCAYTAFGWGVDAGRTSTYFMIFNYIPPFILGRGWGRPDRC